MLKRLLEEMWATESFPYQHVIIDEGQDFGSDAIEGSGVMDTLKAIIEDTKESGSFFAFYDKLQLIQARRMPRPQHREYRQDLASSDFRPEPTAYGKLHRWRTCKAAILLKHR